MPRFAKFLLIFATALLFNACAMQSNRQSAREAEWEKEFAEMVNLAKTKCNNNNAQGCFMLGMVGIESAENNLKQIESAQKYLLKSCDLNHGDGCFAYANVFAMSALVKISEQDKANNFKTDFDTKAMSQDILAIYIKYIKKSCELDSANGCGALGDAYLIGDGVKKDKKLSFFYRKKGCDLAQNYKDDMEKDLAKRASGNGCVKVGRMYYNGEGVAQNKKLALEYFYKGCEVLESRIGYWSHCGSYVQYFYDGYNGESIKVPQDYEFAFKLAQKGCEANDSKSCNYLGILYLEGKGTKQDFKKAFNAFQKLCYEINALVPSGDKSFVYIPTNATGYQELGCYNLALRYANGEGIEQDYKRAFGMFKELCDKDKMSSACGLVGNYYYDAKGVRQDYRSALYYFGMACDMGEQSGCDNHKIMKRNPYAYGLRDSDFR